MSVGKDIHLHLLWLSHGAGHAGAIAARLDDTDKELIKESKVYALCSKNMLVTYNKIVCLRKR